MDAPLFGETKSSSKLVYYGVGGILGIFSTVTVIAAIVTGAKEDFRHIFFAITLCLYLAVFAVLVRWYMKGDLDPKFKNLFILLTIACLFAGVTANLYIWRKLPDVKACKGELYYVESETKGYCVPLCASSYLLNTRTMACQFVNNSLSTHGVDMIDSGLSPLSLPDDGDAPAEAPIEPAPAALAPVAAKEVEAKPASAAGSVAFGVGLKRRKSGISFRRQP
ncbi:uncharacterized protein AMSG_06881 [Thecamonas trahens ATCC 50062]|uniref:Uncharacterized protein n=1 Tax=Thecamonas trahens ATCC 50062 TaxID=461836 RepID=A0A0L0DDU4_THETB|nr:hypothetical protein AMSG_06881 [Thecamonas trahens ATCC 50062]KNC50390.1 hypothetical protein AMSG_06881 [Thecamonas trahens ATCC 50062]|eukprot:XP_013756932.1 hypothetical protein AMSG_06881 [Thecamonas trahens ATCC 50062]